MTAIKNYKIVWNTHANEGTIIIDIPEGVQQIHVDSPQEASLLLNKIRQESILHLQGEQVYTGFDIVGAGEIASKTKKSTAKKKVAAKKKKTKKGKGDKDNLRLVEGIGPKIEGLLNDAGIRTFAELKATKVAFLKAVLEEAGSRYRMHDPTTWPKQAKMAAKGDWEALENWQKELKGGKQK